MRSCFLLSRWTLGSADWTHFWSHEFQKNRGQGSTDWEKGSEMTHLLTAFIGHLLQTDSQIIGFNREESLNWRLWNPWYEGWEEGIWSPLLLVPGHLGTNHWMNIGREWERECVCVSWEWLDLHNCMSFCLFFPLDLEVFVCNMCICASKRMSGLRWMSPCWRCANVSELQEKTMLCVLILPGQQCGRENTGLSLTDASISSIAKPLPTVSFPECGLYGEGEGRSCFSVGE